MVPSLYFQQASKEPMHVKRVSCTPAKHLLTQSDAFLCKHSLVQLLTDAIFFILWHCTFIVSGVDGVHKFLWIIRIGLFLLSVSLNPDLSWLFSHFLICFFFLLAVSDYFKIQAFCWHWNGVWPTRICDISYRCLHVIHLFTLSPSFCMCSLRASVLFSEM